MKIPNAIKEKDLEKDKEESDFIKTEQDEFEKKYNINYKHFTNVLEQVNDDILEVFCQHNEALTKFKKYSSKYDEFNEWITFTEKLNIKKYPLDTRNGKSYT